MAKTLLVWATGKFLFILLNGKLTHSCAKAIFSHQ